MNIGDLVTGIDRSYIRSIYKVVCTSPFKLEFHSFNGKKATFNHQYTVCQAKYRLATEDEIKESENVTYAYQEKPKYVEDALNLINKG